jgi:mannose-6-phosphate isomerase
LEPGDVVAHGHVEQGVFFEFDTGHDAVHSVKDKVKGFVVGRKIKGIVLAEIQQNSNVTYRVYDYDRIDETTGRKRELHVDKALKVIRKYPNYTNYDFGNHLVSCKHFVVDLIEGDTLDFASERSFVSLVVLDGTGRIEFKNDEGANDYLTLSKGESFFIPASSGRFNIKGENLRILRTQI